MQAEINVTPLVDVCLVLLIIFMVVTPMMVNGVPVRLPESKTATSLDDRQLPITVNKDATLYVDANVIRREQLVGDLQRLHAEDPDRPVLVRGDIHAKYGDVADVLAYCRAAGFRDVGLAASHSGAAIAALRAAGRTRASAPTTPLTLAAVATRR